MITDDIKEGCTIIRNQAELLKIKFGSALALQMKENEIVSIPGLRGRPPKEISVRNLANIIQARMEEIIENVNWEIRNSGFQKKLIAGIVVTGGGSQLKHLNQLIQYVTGMDSRIGYPNEHLGTGFEEIKSPMYATGVGLVMNGIRNQKSRKPVSEKSEKVESDVPQKRNNILKRLWSELIDSEEDEQL